MDNKQDKTYAGMTRRAWAQAAQRSCWAWAG